MPHSVSVRSMRSRCRGAGAGEQRQGRKRSPGACLELGDCAGEVIVASARHERHERRVLGAAVAHVQQIHARVGCHQRVANAAAPISSEHAGCSAAARAVQLCTRTGCWSRCAAWRCARLPHPRTCSMAGWTSLCTCPPHAREAAHEWQRPSRGAEQASLTHRRGSSSRTQEILKNQLRAVSRASAGKSRAVREATSAQGGDGWRRSELMLP